MSEYIKGDYTKCYEDICEIWYEDNLYCIVRTDDADKLIDVLNENEHLKFELKECREHKLFSRRQLEGENEQLKQSNQKLNDELQETMGYLALKSGVEKENEQLKQRLKLNCPNIVWRDLE